MLQWTFTAFRKQNGRSKEACSENNSLWAYQYEGACKWCVWTLITCWIQLAPSKVSSTRKLCFLWLINCLIHGSKLGTHHAICLLSCSGRFLRCWRVTLNVTLRQKSRSSCTFLHQCVFKTVGEPEDGLAYAETCCSIKWNRIY